MARDAVPALKTVQAVPVPEPQASIVSDAPEAKEPLDAEVRQFSLARLHKWASTGGNIALDLDDATVRRLGAEAVRRWREDDGSRQTWLEKAKIAIDIATQENQEDEGVKDYPFENASDINYPLLTVAAIQFNGRAMPALVKGDRVFGVKVFEPPKGGPSPVQIARAGPQPQSPQDAQGASQQIQGAQQGQMLAEAALDARRARGERVAMYLNYCAFYRMDNWRGEMDTLTIEGPVVGIGFKKVYRGATGPCSEYVSPLKLVVHNDAKSLWRCPRITQEFDEYPYEIETKQRQGHYERFELPPHGDDPQAKRELIEQHTLEDLDEDGLSEPYILTVDVETQQLLRVEPAYTADDVMLNADTGEVTRIRRTVPYAPFLFLPDPKGRFYGLGFGKLIGAILDSVDTSINQLIDAGTAEIAGGGFVAGDVRLQGSGEAGVLYYRPGEYQTVSASGPDLRNGIWERTVPHPSAVTMDLLQLLLSAAKDITSVKDVLGGEQQPANQPVGTTVALQDAALEVQSAILGRYWDGLKMEGQLLYDVVKRWSTDEDRKLYAELTGGDLDEDFSGDGTDIQAAADPRVITKMQKVSRTGALIQLAESPVGQAAGMLMAGPAQKMVRDVLDTLDVEGTDSYVAAVPPNPLQIAKAQDLQATAQLKQADAVMRGAQIGKDQASATLSHAKAIREIGLASHDTHRLHEIADQITRQGQVAPLPEGEMNGQPPSGPAPAA